jgi:hypothetical protein
MFLTPWNMVRTAAPWTPDDGRGRQPEIDRRTRPGKRKKLTSRHYRRQNQPRSRRSNHFLDTFAKICAWNNIQLIIMGITGSTRLGQVFMGSNTLNLVKRGIAP